MSLREDDALAPPDADPEALTMSSSAMSGGQALVTASGAPAGRGVAGKGPGKRDRPAASTTADVAVRKSKRTTQSSFARPSSIEREDVDPMEVAEEPSAPGFVDLSAALDVALGQQYTHEVHLTHLENEVCFDFQLPPS